MIRFPFQVNRSFLYSGAHPVTVPKSHVHYAEVDVLLSKGADVWISVLGESPVRGQVYHGHAGYGEYYQIRFREPAQLRELRFGDHLDVRMFLADGRVEILLERWPRSVCAA